MLGKNGVLAIVTHGAVYGLVITGIVGTVLTQAALHYGPLAVSQPLMVIVNPFVSIILGIWLYGEHFDGGALEVGRGALGFTAMVLGVVFLAKTAPSLEATPVAHHPPQPHDAESVTEQQPERGAGPAIDTCGTGSDRGASTQISLFTRNTSCQDRTTSNAARELGGGVRGLA